jgi:hypothetical protein
MKGKNFDALLKGTKKADCEVFKVVVANFLGKHKAPNQRTHVGTIPEIFRNMGCNMSLKLHLLYRHLGFYQAT